MNAATTRFVATLALALAAAGSAFAQEATPDAPAPVSTLTRATVAAEAAAHVKAGLTHEWFALAATGYIGAPASVTQHAAGTGVSREAVRAQTLVALRSGEVARLNAVAWQAPRAGTMAMAGANVGE